MESSKVNIIFCGHDLKFITPLIRLMEESSNFNVRILEHKGHHINDPVAASSALEWADVIFCEWALGNAVWFSERKRANQVLIVRLHAQEVRARDRIDFIWRTDWEKVDRLILITQHLYDWMRAEFPVLASRTALVYNPIPARTSLDLPKSVESRFTLGLVGMVPTLKRLDLAVAVLRKLRETDERYCLRVKGSLPTDYPWMAARTEEMAWYERLFHEVSDLRSCGALVFDPHGPDMASWYQEIGHILSVSDFEGSHQAVAEGMATGCIPAIRDWEGADRIYPAKFTANTVESLAEMIGRRSEPDQFIEDSAYSRRFSQDRFDHEPTCSKLVGIIAQEVRRVRKGQLNLSLVRNARLTPNFLLLAYIPVGSRSGYRIRVEQEIQALIQQGCKVHLGCLVPASKAYESSEEQQARDAHVEEFMRIGCVPHILQVEDFFRLNATTESFPSIVIELLKIIQNNDIDVIHAEAIYCARIADAVKVKHPKICFSIDWHGIGPEESQMGGAHHARIVALECAERRLLTVADLNVFVSESMGTHYHRKYGNIGPVQVIVPCCVSDKRFVGVNENSNTMDFPRGSLIFGYAGTMVDWQCGAEMISLFSALHRVDSRCKFLLLVPQSDHKKVFGYCEDAGLPASAMVMMEVPHNEVPQRLQNCDVGVMLRRTDPVNFVSSPTKFGEYLAAGLPVLMTEAIGDYSQLAMRSNVGFVIPSSHITNSSRLLEDPSLLEQIISFVERASTFKGTNKQRLQTIARESLHWESAAVSWIASYRTLLDSCSVSEV